MAGRASARAADARHFVRGRLNTGLARLTNAFGARGARQAPLSLEAALAGSRRPRELARLLAGRTNREREVLVGRWLDAVGAPVRRHAFRTAEGRGINYAVDVGAGPRTLVVVAHHDAVPGSPGANDNAAAVGLLFELLAGLTACSATSQAGRVPAGLRVRLLWTAAEERGYLGARAWVRTEPPAAAPPAEIVGVVSLELCGVGDAIVLWDVEEEGTGEGAFQGRLRAALAGLGLAPEAGYFVVGRLPVFGSDHRAFAALGVPACGLSVVPSADAPALRSFALSPWRGIARQAVRRPRPFDTYHTWRDTVDTLEDEALALAGRALEAIVAAHA